MKAEYRVLTPRERRISMRTIGAYAFFPLVVDALLQRKSLSVIRVSDGEKAALDYAKGRQPGELLKCCDEGFRKRFGVDGITCGEVAGRIYQAAATCTHFAPTLGFFKPEYNLTPYFDEARESYVDEMYQYHWSRNMRRDLCSLARVVSVINRDSQAVSRMQAALPGVFFRQVYLTNWDGAEYAKQEAITAGAPLVLMSAALGSKWIGPAISRANNSVVLDIGQAADEWLQ